MKHPAQPPTVQPIGEKVAIVAPNKDFAFSHAFDLRIQESRVILVQTVQDAIGLPADVRVEIAPSAVWIKDLDAIRDALAGESRDLAGSSVGGTAPPAGPQDDSELAHFRQLATEAKEKFRDRGWTGYGLFIGRPPGKPPQLFVCRAGQVKYRAFRHPTQGIWFTKQTEVPDGTEWSDQL